MVYESYPAGPKAMSSLVDLRAQKITGKGSRSRSQRPITTANKFRIPNDPEKPFVTSGIRIGSPAMTTGGFTEIEGKRSPTIC